MSLQEGDVCKTLDPGHHGDWKKSGRLCTVEQVHNADNVVVRFHDGDGWAGGCWGMPTKYLELVESGVGYEVDA